MNYVARWSDGFAELVKDTAERLIGFATMWEPPSGRQASVLCG
jgi:hypothetical protein